MIPDETRSFVESLIEYYISEVDSYIQMAETYGRAGAERDTAFGIIVGCVWSGFMQSCQNQGISPDLPDIQEFGDIIKSKAQLIRAALDKDKNEPGPAGDST